MWPILVAGIVAMSAAAFDAAETAYGTATGEPLLALPEAWQEPFSWLLFLARLLVPIGLVVGSLRLRRAGGPLVALAVGPGLGPVPRPARVRARGGARAIPASGSCDPIRRVAAGRRPTAGRSPPRSRTTRTR